MAGTSSSSFPKRRRLRTRSEYLGMQRGSGRFSRGSLLLLVGRSPHGTATASRLGMVISRKVGTAVKRNAIKRWLREWFRTRGAELPRGLDLVVIAKPGAAERGHAALLDDVGALLLKVIALRPGSVVPGSVVKEPR